MFSHAFPFLRLAASLEKLGHAVAFFSANHGYQALLSSAGLHGHAYLSSHSAAGVGDRGVRARRGNAAWMSRWAAFNRNVVAGHVTSLLAAAADFQPDLIVTDPLAFHGVIAAELLHVPWASLSVTLLPIAPEESCQVFRRTIAELGYEPEEHFASHGVTAEFKCGYALSPWLNAIFAHEEFVRPLAVKPDSRYPTFLVGPSPPPVSRVPIESFPWARLSADKPVVYVTHGGSQSFPVSTLEAIADSLGSEEADVVLALADMIDEPFVESLPDHVIAVRHVPQFAVLRRASAVVFHGGLSTTMESLIRGVPMLVIPMAYDTPIQAELIAANGVGESIPLMDATPHEIRRLLVPMLASNSVHRQRAQAAARSLEGRDGAGEACSLILELARTRRPLVSDWNGIASTR